ncbi:MAG: flavin reductase family protein [Pseudomonadota bacterium]
MDTRATDAAYHGGVDQNAFRRAMAQAPSGVTVTTAAHGGEAHGLTVSSFTSVSLEPLLCLVCIQKSSVALPMIERSGRFAVHVLGADQEDDAQFFASAPPEARLSRMGVAAGQAPRLERFLVRFSFDLFEMRPAGDHRIVLGEARRIETARGDAAALGEAAFDGLADPLTWWRSEMGSLAPRG